MKTTHVSMIKYSTKHHTCYKLVLIYKNTKLKHWHIVKLFLMSMYKNITASVWILKVIQFSKQKG